MTADVHRNLRAAERRYRLLVERLPGTTYVNDAGGIRTQYVSPQIEGLLGYTAEDFVAEPSLFESLVHPDDRERVQTAVTEVRASSGSVTVEYRMIARDGSVVWVEDYADVVTDDDGTPLYVQGHLRDITEVHTKIDHLHEHDRLKDEFIALVSHELRTPLTPILGYVEFLLEMEPTAEQEHYLGVIDRNARRLQRLVGDLLFMARVDAGKLALEEGRFDLARVVTNAVEGVQPQATTRSVLVETAIEAVDALYGDAERIGQLVDNLLSNAVKFTPAEGRVTIAIRSQADAAVIEVTDTGIGIPAAEQDRLFEKFFRTSTATTNAIQGTGLGLAVSKAIVEAHGGTIGFESVEGEGTTFRVTLPPDRTRLAAAA